MKTIAFTVADEKNKPYAEMMIRSFHHFHPDIEVKIYDETAIGNSLNYYRATPLFARDLIKSYDCVLKLDADQIITGDLSYIFENQYDMAGVMNFSRSDVKEYGIVTTADIPNTEYFNCGLVAMRSKRFIDHWWALCNSYHFGNFPYKEQDLMNIMISFGDYDVLNLDKPVPGYSAWHGLLSKGEWNKMVLRVMEKVPKAYQGQILPETNVTAMSSGELRLILPKAPDRYPEQDKEIKVMHWAGGNNSLKMNYRTYCSEEVITYLDSLVK